MLCPISFGICNAICRKVISIIEYNRFERIMYFDGTFIWTNDKIIPIFHILYGRNKLGTHDKVPNQIFLQYNRNDGYGRIWSEPRRQWKFWSICEMSWMLRSTLKWIAYEGFSLKFGCSDKYPENLKLKFIYKYLYLCK